MKQGGIWVKQAFDSIVNDMVGGSVVYYLPSIVKAPGSVIRHAVAAADNTATRRNEIGFTMWNVCVNTKDEGSAAIVSPTP